MLAEFLQALSDLWAGTPQPILDTEMWIDYVRVWA